MNLNDVLNDDATRTSIIEEVCQLVDDEVAKQRGLSGVAVKAGYKVVQSVKPGFVRNVVQSLLPEFAAALEPIREQAVAQGKSVSDYFGAHTYERIDRPRGEFFHTNWTGEGGDTTSTTYNR